MTGEIDVLVIGAGPTGLSAARELERLGARWQLLEAASDAGGLAGSHVDDHGFTWDYGGHVQHSHYDSFDRAMDEALGADGWLTQQRAAVVWTGARFVPYPFQLHLHHLDTGDCQRALAGLERAAAAHGSYAAPPRHFDEWIVRSFGEGLADLFMRPYNRKVWATPLERLGYGWIADRVAVPDVAAIARAVARREDASPWGPNSTFRYPLRGGTGAPWRAMAAALADGIHYGQRVVRVDVHRHEVHLAGGRVVRYGALVSTLPLDGLLRAIGVDAPFDPASLVYSSVDVVGVGIRGPLPEALAERGWIYFPEAASPYFRATVLSRYSPFNVPEPGAYWSLMTESARPSAVPASPRVQEDVLTSLRRDRLLPADADIVSLTHVALPHGYPTPFLGRDATVDPMLRWLEAHGIFSRGRFGAWKYEVSNQDHSFAQGQECARRIVSGGDARLEPTLHTPAAVNARRNP